jgi:glycerate 2-kinase
VKILVAPDSFKGTYSADHVADAIADGIRAAGALPIRQPAADGGEGTVAALAAPLCLAIATVSTVDPWGAAIEATYGLSLTGTAVVEVAAASGHSRDAVGRPGAAVDANSYGTGVMIADAVRRGARHVIVAAGGSASTDGGLGAITAIRDRGGMGNARMTVLTDVASRFADAAKVFAPQKGAVPADVTALTQRLSDLAQTLPRDPSSVDGSGAAGGLAGGLWSVFDADLRSGSEYVLDACGFNASVAASAAVIVGEGRLDRQTQSGKLIDTILRRAGSRPVFAVVGSTAPDIGAYAQHFAAVLHARNPAEMRRAGTVVAQQLLDVHPDHEVV